MEQHKKSDIEENAGFLKIMKEVPYYFVKVVRCNDLKLAKKILALGANVNEQNENGNTALLYAAKKGNLEMVNWLLDNGANPNG